MCPCVSSFELRKLHSWVLEDSEQDFAALVDANETLSRRVNNLGRQSLSVLDQSLFNDLQHLIWATAHVGKIVQYLSQLIQFKVSVETLID